MKKMTGNTPSAYQTIAEFCEEGSFTQTVEETQHLDNPDKRSTLTALRSLVRNPLRRKSFTNVE